MSEQKEMYCMSGLPAVGKTTTANWLDKTKRWKHLDGDDEIHRIMVASKLPSRIAQHKQEEFLRQALSKLHNITQNTDKLPIISGLMIHEVARKTVVQAMKELEYAPVFVEIQAKESTIIRENQKRQSLKTPKRRKGIRYASMETVQKHMQDRTEAHLDEGWARIVLLQREKIRRNRLPEIERIIRGEVE